MIAPPSSDASKPPSPFKPSDSLHSHNTRENAIVAFANYSIR